MPSAFTVAAIFLSVPVTVFWIFVLPHWMTAAGVSGVLPFLIRLVTMDGRVVIPINITIVSTPVAILFQAIELFSFKGSSCPVIKAIVDE